MQPVTIEDQMIERVREALALCGIKRTFLAAQEDKLRRETRRALQESRRVGIPRTEACALAGVSRSGAYARYGLSTRGGDDAGSNGTGGNPSVG